jgi:putative sterol carrier protein
LIKSNQIIQYQLPLGLLPVTRYTMTDPAPSLEHIFAAMAEVVEMDGTIKKKFNGTALFDVGGKTFLLQAKRDDNKNNSKSDPDLEIKTSMSTLLDLLAKKITAQQAFMKGKLKIKGKMGLAMKLSVVLDATRKHLALQHSNL